MMDYLKSVFTKNRIILLITAGGALLLGLILTLIGVGVTSKLKDQQFAKRWSGDNSYAQVSAFFSEMSGFDEDKVKELTHKIESKLGEDSITAPSENARLCVTAYSANGKITISSSSKSVDVKAIGVGGDFFLFHPLELVTGSFFDGEDVMQDYVILDEDTAWNLFGSNNIVGQFVEIGGVRHVVLGVIKRDDGRLNDLAGNKEPTVYMSFDSLKNNGTAGYINTFEALMPNVLTGYAKGVVSDNLSSIDETRYSVIENSGRFYFTKLLKNVSNFGTRGMNGKGLVYPYWENIARGYEDYLTPVACIATVCYAYAFVIVFITLIRMWRLRQIHFKDVKDFVERQIEVYRERKANQKEGEYYE